MEASTLIMIILKLTKKYQIKLNNLRKQPLSRNETKPNIWNEANIQYFNTLFEYKNSLKIKMWWDRLTKKLLENAHNLEITNVSGKFNLKKTLLFYNLTM